MSSRLLMRCSRSLGALSLGIGACVAPDAPTVTIDPAFPTVARVAWTGEGRGYVRYEDADSALVTPTEATSSSSHDVAVIGLHPGHPTTLTAVTVDDDGDEQPSPPVEVTVPGRAPSLRLDSVAGESDGFVLTHVLTQGVAEAVVVVDGAGNEVWRHAVALDERILSVNQVDDGTLWFTAAPLSWDRRSYGVAHHLSLDGAVNEAFEIDRLHSAVVPGPDGLLHLARAIAPWEDREILWDRVMERREDGSERVVFDFREAFAPVPTCEHQDSVIDGRRLFDWTHANMLLLSPDGATVYVMSRHLDALFAIDRLTGAVRWTLGGRASDFAVDVPFEHAHTSWYRDGRLWVMDNGNHRGASRVIGYDVDEAARTAVAAVVYDEPSGGVVEHLGDAKPTGAGDLLVSWTTLGRVERLDPDGTPTWSIEAAIGGAPGRATYLDDLYGPATAP